MEVVNNKVELNNSSNNNKDNIIDAIFSSLELNEHTKYKLYIMNYRLLSTK